MKVKSHTNLQVCVCDIEGGDLIGKTSYFS